MRLTSAARTVAAILVVALAAASALGGPFQIIAKTGDPVAFPGATGTYLGFGVPQSNASGNLVFTAHFIGAGVNYDNNALLVSKNAGGVQRLVARSGVAPAGAPAGSHFSYFGDYRINDQGTVLFENRMVPPTTDPNQYTALWSDNGALSLIDYGVHWRTAFGGDFYQDTYLYVDGFDAAGTLLYHKSDSYFSGSTVTSGPKSFWVKKAQESPRQVVAQNDGYFQDGTLIRYSYLYDSPSLLNDGRVVFSAQLIGNGITSTNNDTIWTDNNGDKQIIIRDGQPAPGLPGGVNLYHINTSTADGLGNIAFRALVTGPGVDSTNSDALFSTAGGTPHFVARLGQSLSGLNHPAKISSLYDLFHVRGDTTSFLAELSDGANYYGQGWFAERGGVLRPIAYSGEAAPGFDGYAFSDQTA